MTNDLCVSVGAGGAADFGHVDHIGTDREVVIPVGDVRPSLEIVLAMYQSAHRGKAVEWPVEDDLSVWE